MTNAICRKIRGFDELGAEVNMWCHNHFIEMHNSIHQLEVELLIQLGDYHMRFAGGWGAYYEVIPIKMGYQQ